MATGIAGDSGAVLVGTYPAEDLMTIELRVIANLLANVLGNGTASLDELRVLRNDQAFELGLSVPVPGQ
jgi:hypothetical protein